MPVGPPPIAFVQQTLEAVARHAADHGWPAPRPALEQVRAAAGRPHDLLVACALLGGALAAAETSPGARRLVAEQLVWSAVRCAPTADGALEERLELLAIFVGDAGPDSDARAMSAVFAVAAEAAALAL